MRFARQLRFKFQKNSFKTLPDSPHNLLSSYNIPLSEGSSSTVSIKFHLYGLMKIASFRKSEGVSALADTPLPQLSILLKMVPVQPRRPSPSPA